MINQIYKNERFNEVQTLHRLRENNNYENIDYYEFDLFLIIKELINKLFKRK